MMEDNSVSCKLKIPKDLNGKTPAFLVNFSNGCINLNNSNKLNFTCYQTVATRRNDGSKSKRLLMASNGRLNYKSITSDESSPYQDKVRYCVGVRNKVTGKMKIYESISFHLKPLLNMKSDLQASSSETKNIRERLDDLTSSFGSKGKKRSMAARLKYSADTGLLDNTLDDMALDDYQRNTDYSISSPKTSTEIEYMPPQNREAQSVDEVYDIHDIISTEEDKYLRRKAQEILQDISVHFSRWKTDGTYCEYILQHMEKTPDSTEVKYLLYYHYLFIFSQLLSSDMKKSDPASQIPEPIKSNLLEHFTVSSTLDSGRIVRNFPLKMKDKLLAYILVLALFIDNYQVNLSVLQKGMKFGMPKVIKVAQALGCYVSRHKVETLNLQFAELKLPLFTLPKYYKKF